MKYVGGSAGWVVLLETKKNMKKTIILLAMAFIGQAGVAQVQESTPLASFNKIVASPRVNVILEKGDKESIRILYNDIPKSSVNVIVRGNKLKIYLDHARTIEKQVRRGENGNSHKRGIYAGSSITAYVTYKELTSVEIRGEEELRCDSEISGEKFKLRAYGESEIRLASLNVKKFKTSLYGENDLKVTSGTVSHQVYRLFGDNKIDTHGLTSEVATTRMYGEGKIIVNASDEVHISAFGEPTIRVEGTSFISKGIIIGRADIRTNH